MGPGDGHPGHIRLDRVTVRRGDRLALDAATVDVPCGAVTAVIGPNGAGKTTLLHLLAGVLEPTSGYVTDGCRPGGRPRVSLVAQHAEEVWMPLTVREVITMARYGRAGLWRRLSPEDRAAVTSAADRLEVTPLLARPFGELSGGERQRVRVAQAIAAGPDLLLLDEPITGLDLASQQRISEITREEADRGTTVVMSTHHIDEASECDVVVLLATAVVAVGPAAEVLTAAHLRSAYGSRVIEVGGVLVDDHGHGHGHDHGHGGAHH